jgi:hypothetical protein
LGAHGAAKADLARFDRDRPETKEGSAMALSNDEQRTLDEIECALRDDDPAFVYAVSLDHHRAIVGGFASPTGTPGRDP